MLYYMQRKYRRRQRVREESESERGEWERFLRSSVWPVVVWIAGVSRAIKFYCFFVQQQFASYFLVLQEIVN